MKNNQLVIDNLNKQLTLELTSMDQYLAHSKIYEDWDITKLSEKISHEHEEELDHAKKLSERILFLGGKPDTVSRAKVNIGSNVKEMLEFDLAAEYEVAESLRKIIAICEAEKDYVSRTILDELLVDTEMDHIYWLTQHLGLIEKIGLQNYIQSQM
jgi:bacterioferritin